MLSLIHIWMCIRDSYDPGCYLCPGNARAGGARNPDYEATFVFTNDFAALEEYSAVGGVAADPSALLRAEAVMKRLAEADISMRSITDSCLLYTSGCV